MARTTFNKHQLRDMMKEYNATAAKIEELEKAAGITAMRERLAEIREAVDRETGKSTTTCFDMQACYSISTIISIPSKTAKTLHATNRELFEALSGTVKERRTFEGFKEV